jgi:hypothetical protein
MKVRIKKLGTTNPYEGKWCNAFLEDLIRNEGKVITLHEYKFQEGKHHYRIMTDEYATWNDSKQWTGHDGDDEFRFCYDTNYFPPVALDEDLFTI